MASVVTVQRSVSEWVRSEFPHPLVTLDYDKDDNLINVEVVGNDMKVRVDGREV